MGGFCNALDLVGVSMLVLGFMLQLYDSPGGNDCNNHKIDGVGDCYCRRVWLRGLGSKILDTVQVVSLLFAMLCCYRLGVWWILEESVTMVTLCVGFRRCGGWELEVKVDRIRSTELR